MYRLRIWRLQWEVVCDAEMRDWGRRNVAAGGGPMQGPLQLGSTTQAWKDALGDADVGRWQLIYRLLLSHTTLS